MKSNFILLAIGLCSLASAAVWAQPKVEVTVTQFDFIDGKMTSGALACTGSAPYVIQDVRTQKDQNANPVPVFSNCTANQNGKTLQVSAFAGVAILNGTGRNGKMEDQKIYEVSLNVGDQIYSNWNTSFDLSAKDRLITWDIPAPAEFKLNGATQWVRVAVTFTEENP